MAVEKKKPFGEYQTAVLVGGGTLLAVIVLGVALGMPLVNSMKSSQTELKTKQAELKDLNDRLAILKTLDSKKEELVKQNEKVLAALPEDTDVSRLFVQFEKVATENGITIQTVSGSTANSGVKATGTVTPVTYTITGTAKNYSSLKSALAKIETALRVVAVGKMDVSDSGNGLNTNLNVTTYVRGTGK